MRTTMIAHVTSAQLRGAHRVWIRFDDGLEGEGELDGEIFEPLRDPAYFARFTVDDTSTWPSGAELAPEFLRELVVRGRAA